MLYATFELKCDWVLAVSRGARGSHHAFGGSAKIAFAPRPSPGRKSDCGSSAPLDLETAETTDKEPHWSDLQRSVRIRMDAERATRCVRSLLAQGFSVGRCNCARPAECFRIRAVAMAASAARSWPL